MRRALALMVVLGLLGLQGTARADEKVASGEIQRSLDVFRPGQLLFRGEFTLGFNKLEGEDWSGDQKRVGYRLNFEYLLTELVAVGAQVGAEYFHDSQLLILVGPRVSFYPFGGHRVRPYFSLSAGYAHWSVANRADALGAGAGVEVGMIVRLSDDGVLGFLSAGYTFLYGVVPSHDSSSVVHSIPVTLGFGRAF